MSIIISFLLGNLCILIIIAGYIFIPDYWNKQRKECIMIGGSLDGEIIKLPRGCDSYYTSEEPTGYYLRRSKKTFRYIKTKHDEQS